MEFEGFGNNNEDSEYELKLTPEIRIIFEGAGDFYLEAEFADYNPGKYKDLNLLDFSIIQKNRNESLLMTPLRQNYFLS